MRWLCGLLFAASLASANTYVIAAGVEKYDDPGIVSLQFAVADVTSLADLFSQRGVATENIILLTSAATNFAQRPTRSNVLAALQRVRRKAVAGDTVVFVFSGHGMEVDNQAYLLTVDSSRELLKDTALPMTLVHEALRGLQADNLLFVIDACRNDPTSSKAVADAEFAEPFAKGLRPKLADEDRNRTASNIAILTACDVGQRAWEIPEEGHGVFTYYLLEALNGGAADEQGLIRLSTLGAYLKDEVTSWAERARREQTPRLDISEGQDFPLLTVPVKPQPIEPQPTPPARLSIESEPAGAEVTLNGEPLGKTPLNLDVPLTGEVERQVVVKLDGFQEFQTKVTLIPGKPARVPLVKLEKIVAEPVKPEPREPVTDPGQRPGWWPDYLKNYQIPDGMRWSDYRIRTFDGMVQVRIPAGEVTIGDPDTRGMQRLFRTDGFWMDLYELSLKQVCEFYDQEKLEMPLKILRSALRTIPYHPMTYVPYDRAELYAAKAGRRLPTPDEWEYAARAGVSGMRFGWGNDWDPKLANAMKQNDGPVQIGSYAPNAYGLLDMVGNVAEWCAAKEGELPQVRGGGYQSDEFTLQLHAAPQRAPNTEAGYIGFRCVEDE